MDSGALAGFMVTACAMCATYVNMFTVDRVDTPVTPQHDVPRPPASAVSTCDLIDLVTASGNRPRAFGPSATRRTSPQLGPPPGLSDDGVLRSDDGVLESLSLLDLDTFIAYVSEEVQRRCIEECKLFSKYVEHRMTWLKHCDVLRAIQMEAERDFEELIAVCGSAIKFTNCAVTSYDDWEELKCGYQGKPGVRKYRVLVTLRLAVQLFELANVDHFLEHGTVRYRMRELPQVSSLCEGSTTAWERKWAEWMQMGLVEEGQAVLEVQAVELALDYTKCTTQVVFQRPDCSRGTAKAMLAMWSKALISTKRAQMQLESTDDWPPVAMRPWKFDTFWLMPVVLWIRENKHPMLSWNV